MRVKSLLVTTVAASYILLVCSSCKEDGNQSTESQGQTSGVKGEARSYKIVETEDQSHKASVRKRSDYTYQEWASLPINRKMLYRVAVSSKIKENQVRRIVEEIIADITTKNGDIDDITLFLYSDQDIVHGPYDVGIARWIPRGVLVTPEIAQNNSRTGYKTSIRMNKDIKDIEEYLHKRSKSEERFELTEVKRRQLFKEIVAAEDKAQLEADRVYPITGRTFWPLTEPERRSRIKNNIHLQRQLDEEYKNDLTKKYGIAQGKLKETALEGVVENWPMPRLER